eukprot:Skav218594  [mRNA]  locus=scaffold3628:37675:44778:+ [translate_table: standard]
MKEVSQYLAQIESSQDLSYVNKHLAWYMTVLGNMRNSSKTNSRKVAALDLRAGMPGGAGDLVQRVEEWISNVEKDDAEEKAVADLMSDMITKLEKPQTATRPHYAHALIHEAMEKMEKQRHDSMQSFYGKEAEAKPKAKAKAKARTHAELPRFDLARSFPKRCVVTWQSVQHALELGEEPQGQACVCKSVEQIQELQAMAKSMNLRKALMLVAHVWTARRMLKHTDGYVVVSSEDAEALMKSSGKGGAFVTLLSRNLLKKPDVPWLFRSTEASDAQYYQTVWEAAQAAKVGMAFRKADGNDLGILQKNQSPSAGSWAVWETPKLVKSSAHVADRNRGGSIYGAPPNVDEDYFAYKIGDRHMTISKWQPKRKVTEEPKIITGAKWFDHKFLEKEEKAAVVVREVKPTLIDPPTPEVMEVDANTDEKRKIQSDNKSKDKSKKARATHEPEVKHGMAGPSQTKVIDLGGTGDCGWRACGFLLALYNTKEPDNYPKQIPRAQQLGQSLKGQCNNFLLNKCTDWKDNWVPDSDWTTETEGGEPAKTLVQYCEDAMRRESRYIDHYGLQAISCAKKACVVIWKLEEHGWTRVALLRPSKPGKHVVLPLVFYGRHYMALVRDGIGAYALDWVHNKLPEGAWVSEGIQNDIIEASQGSISTSLFRGAGADTPRTPARNKNSDEDLEALLRTVSSRKSDEGIQQLLKTPSMAATPKSAKSSGRAEPEETDLEHLLKSCTRRATKLDKGSGKKKWRCPSCSHTIEIVPKAGKVISQHLQKLHFAQWRSTLETNRKDGTASKNSGLGLRKLFSPADFKTVAKKSMAKADFVCPYCHMALDKQPSSGFIRAKTKKHHLETCAKRPQDINVRQYFHQARCVISSKLAVNRYAAWKQSYTQATIDKAAVRGHKVVSLAWKFMSKSRQMRKNRLYVCVQCRASRPVGGPPWRSQCKKQFYTWGKGLSPSTRWWYIRSKEGSLAKLFKLMEISDTEQKTIRAAVKNYRGKMETSERTDVHTSEQNHGCETLDDQYCWTSGTWRLFEVLSLLKVEERPMVIGVPELKCNKEEWLATQNRIWIPGFRFWKCVVQGNQKRGVCTLVSVQVKATQIAELSHQLGSALAVGVDNQLHLNSHAPVREADRAEFCAEMVTWIHTLPWRRNGAMIAYGDWNEEFGDGWIASLLCARGLEYIECGNTDCKQTQAPKTHQPLLSEEWMSKN